VVHLPLVKALSWTAVVSRGAESFETEAESSPVAALTAVPLERVATASEAAAFPDVEKVAASAQKH